MRRISTAEQKEELKQLLKKQYEDAIESIDRDEDLRHAEGDWHLSDEIEKTKPRTPSCSSSISMACNCSMNTEIKSIRICSGMNTSPAWRTAGQAKLTTAGKGSEDTTIISPRVMSTSQQRASALQETQISANSC